MARTNMQIQIAASDNFDNDDFGHDGSGPVDFAYGTPAHDAAGQQLSMSIFADRPHLRDELAEDALLAGMRVLAAGDITGLLSGEARPLGEVVLVDCPQLDAAHLAALARLDLRAHKSGAALIVSTTLDSLNDVFGCLDQSNPQILINPTRGERVLALGQVLGRMSPNMLRELTEEDRLTLFRMTEHLAQISRRLERLEMPSTPAISEPVMPSATNAEASAFRFEAPKRPFTGQSDNDGDSLVRSTRPSSPDPRLIRKILLQRQLRAKHFDGDLFADPAWDMLLDLTAARAEYKRVSITSLCIASGVPPTTALRWVGQMVDMGLFERIEDDTDRRRAFVALTDKAADAMARLFAEMGADAKRMI